MTFEALQIQPNIIRALNEQGITSPTLIQRKAIPLSKAGNDVIGMSKTGSGKTIAFGIPMLEKVIPKKGLQGLVLAPTRELAVQISNELKKFGKYSNISIATVYGGVALNPQIKAMARSEILVSTPGRILDHLQRNNVDFSKITCAVLDEADKMVEMGFIEDIEKIMNQTPKGRQVLLFGATLSEEIQRLKQKYMRNPMVAKAESHVKEEYLKQYYYNTQSHEKFSLLVHLLKKENTERVIIFCSTRTTVDILTKNLRAQGLKAEMIHGKLTQNRRLKVMENFNKGYPKILVASAVAARGLDIKEVTHIFNYDLSQDPQEYIHRVGRTARAGESGKAITLLCQRDYGTFNDILSRYPVQIEKLPRENFQKLRFQARQQSYRRQPSRWGLSMRNSAQSRF